MTKLSANRAAKEAGVAKKTLLEAITSKRMSAEKNGKGYWEIDPSELFRVFPKTSGEGEEKTVSHPPQKSSENTDLEVEVAVLREKLNSADSDKGHLMKEIDALRERAERAESKEDALQRLLPPPEQDTKAELPRKKLTILERLTGRVAR